MIRAELRRRLAALERRRAAGGPCAHPWHHRRWLAPAVIDYRRSIRALIAVDPDAPEPPPAPPPAPDRCPACGATAPVPVQLRALPYPTAMREAMRQDAIAARLLTEEGEDDDD